MWRCLFFCLLLFPLVLHAETRPAERVATPPLVVAVIDMQRILQESLAAKSVQRQLETQRAKFQAEISEQEKQLQAADTQLKEARGTASAEVLAAREQQLRQRYTEVEREVQTKRHALDDAFATAMGGVRANLLNIVHEVAGQRGITLVLLKQQALWHDPAFDMTDEVLNRLNARLAEVPVKVKLPETDADAASTPNKPDDKARK